MWQPQPPAKKFKSEMFHMHSKAICYCFSYTEEEIINDVIANSGKSTILEKIMAEKRKGGCNCQWTHPEVR